MGWLDNWKNKRRQAHSLVLHQGPPRENPRILFVSHEATRTGAPKIILNVLKHFHEKTNANLQSILHSGGFLAEEFGHYSEVDCLNVPREPSEELSRKIRKICARYRENPPVMAICNSMESRFIAYELHQLGVPITFLVHELPSSYQDHDYHQVYESSERIIFPVDAVREAAHARVPVPSGKVHVMAQGLLQSDFGSLTDRNAARQQIRQELGVPEDAWIVLGCGTLDLRKGIDHFCGVARTILAQNKMNRPVHFVWVGEGDRWTHSPYHYVMLDVEKTGGFHNVHFIGEREDVQPWFVGSDTFILTSRVDPFPCVIHEAMAAGLPVITFHNSGGAAAAVSEGAGIVTPYGDYLAMTDMIQMLASQPALADSIRATARQKVHAKYRFDLYANKLIQMAERTTRCRLSQTTLETEPRSYAAEESSGANWSRAA
ncbi:MAG: glycosyltransferase family 4 protein [Pirellulaceae bacterium]